MGHHLMSMIVAPSKPVVFDQAQGSRRLAALFNAGALSAEA